MAARADSFDVAGLNLHPGEARRVELDVALGDYRFGTDAYRTEPAAPQVLLEFSRMAGNGLALRLRFGAQIAGPCMRCLEDAEPRVEVDAREIDQPGAEDPELTSPYVSGGELDIRAWAHDAFALALPAQVLCRPGCAGLCPRCGANLNEDPGHEHEPQIDPRWAKLGELRLDLPVDAE